MDRSVSLGSGLESLCAIFADERQTSAGELERSGKAPPRSSSFPDILLSAPSILTDFPEAVAFRQSLHTAPPPHSSPVSCRRPSGPTLVRHASISPLLSPSSPAQDAFTSCALPAAAEPARNPSELLERFQHRLAAEIGKGMAAAAASPGDARTIALSELLSNLMGSIEPHVRRALAAVGVNLGDGTTKYFQLLAQHYGHALLWAPENEALVHTAVSNGEAQDRPSPPTISHVRATSDLLHLIPLFSRLWSHELFPPVFALLFHLWILGQSDDVRYTVDAGNHFTVLINGANRLFWHDLLAGTRDYSCIYGVILSAATHPSKLNELPSRLRGELHELVFRFYLYYEKPEDLQHLLKQLPSMPEIADNLSEMGDQASVDGDGASQISSLTETSALQLAHGATPSRSTLRKQRQATNLAFFVNELCRHLRGIRSEVGLLYYLAASAAALEPLPLDVHSANRLQAVLSTCATPGGPLYPTRRVRHAAQAAMDMIFPMGRMARRMVHICFRLLHPFTWPKSLFHWSHNTAQAAAVAAMNKVGCSRAYTQSVSGINTVLSAIRYAFGKLCCRSRAAPAALPAPTVATSSSATPRASPPAGEHDDTAAPAPSPKSIQIAPLPVLLNNDTRPVAPASDDEDLSLWEYLTSSYSVSVIASRVDCWLGQAVAAIPIVPLERAAAALASLKGKPKQS